MDWRKIKVGKVIWYVNKSGPDRLSGPCLELWKGTVISIDPKCVHPVCCEWNRVGGHANWVRPEYGWHTGIFIPGIIKEQVTENPDVFPTAEKAIEHYLKGPREKLMEQAKQLENNNG